MQVLLPRLFFDPRQHLLVGRPASITLFLKGKGNLGTIGAQSHLTSQRLRENEGRGEETGRDATPVLPHLELSTHRHTKTRVLF